MLAALASLACGRDANVEVAPLPRLHAQGTRIVDPAGSEVILKGVNLGGWLFDDARRALGSRGPTTR